MGSGPGSPFGVEDKAPWTSWMINFGGFTDSPHPHKQETRGLDTIQTTSLFSLVAISLLSRTFLRQREICKKILKSGKIVRNHRPTFNIVLIPGPQGKQLFNWGGYPVKIKLQIIVWSPKPFVHNCNEYEQDSNEFSLLTCSVSNEFLMLLSSTSMSSVPLSVCNTVRASVSLPFCIRNRGLGGRNHIPILVSGQGSLTGQTYISCRIDNILSCGVVRMAESSECGFEPHPRPWCLCTCQLQNGWHPGMVRHCQYVSHFSVCNDTHWYHKFDAPSL